MANSVDPDQTAPIGAVYFGSTLFSSIPIWLVMLGNYLQQTPSAENIFFLALKGLMSLISEIPEIKDDRQTILASNTWQSLTPPFIDEPWPPLQLQQSWLIEAPEGEVIAYYVSKS